MSDFLAPVVCVPRQCGVWLGGYWIEETWRDGSTRCPNHAAYWLLTPDGTLCPGGPVCEECAVRILTEYSEKLDEWWSIEPLRLLAGDSNTEWRYAS